MADEATRRKYSEKERSTWEAIILEANTYDVRRPTVVVGRSAGVILTFPSKGELTCIYSVKHQYIYDRISSSETLLAIACVFRGCWCSTSSNPSYSALTKNRAM